MELDKFLSSPIAARHIIASEHKKGMKQLLGPLPSSPKNTGAYLRCGLLDTCTPGDTAFSGFKSVAETSEWWLRGKSGLTLFELASPVLSADAIRELWKWPSTSDAAKTALAANPNNPRALVGDIFSRARTENYVLCAARFGDLTNPDIRDIVTANTYEGKEKERIENWLAARTDLTPVIMANLKGACNQQAYITLSRQANFLAEYSPPTPAELNTVLTPDCVRLPPNAPPETVQAAFDSLDKFPYSSMMTNSANARAIIASHPNAPEKIMRAAIEDDSARCFLGACIPISESPHAAWAIPLTYEKQLDVDDEPTPFYEEVAELRDCPPELLEWVIDATPTSGSENRVPARWSAAVAAMAHPNFPWEKVSPERIRASISAEDLPAVLAVSRLAGHRGSAVVESLADPECCGEEVFSPSTSARRLEQISKEHHASAAWCAMHPNGADIKVSKTYEQVVQNFQAKFACVTLSGKGATAPTSKGTGIEL